MKWLSRSLIALVETTNTDLSGKLAMTSLKAILDLQQYKPTEIDNGSVKVSRYGG